MSGIFGDLLANIEQAGLTVLNDAKAAGSAVTSAPGKALGVIEARAMSAAQAVKGALSPQVPSGVSADSAGWAAKAAEIRRWQNALNSRDRLEVSRTPGSKMSAAIAVWNRTEAAGALADIDDAASVAGAIADSISAGVTPAAGTTSEYDRSAATALASYAKAIDYAQRINAKIDSDSKAAARTVGAYDVARVIPVVGAAEDAYYAVKGAPEAYKSFQGTINKAVDVVEGAAAKATSGLGSFAAYAPWVLGGLGLLYLLPFLPSRPAMHRNPSRRRRAR